MSNSTDQTPESKEASHCDQEDSLVCYCYRLTTRDLKAAFKKYGSLKGVEENTRAGSGCTGCKVLLANLFGEDPADHYKQHINPLQGTSCQKPGSRTQKGFIIANDQLESVIYSANATAPQLGTCDSTVQAEFLVVDNRGIPVLAEQRTVKNNETFLFDTRQISLPRPFFGQFFLTYGRANFGAARFNVYWTNGKSYTSTHENASTGRTRMFLPVVVDEQFLEGPNTIHFAVMNPHHITNPVLIRVFDLHNPSRSMEWEFELKPYSTVWMNANESFYAPLLRKYPKGSFTLNIISKLQNLHQCVSVYFFVHNRVADIWNGNHL